MHSDSKRNPKVLKSVLKYSGVIPKAATAMDGSMKFLLLLARIASLDLIAGHQAGTSSIM